MSVHVPTMFALQLLAVVVMGSALALVARNRHPDLGSWSVALFLQAAGYLLIVLRGSIPDLVSIVVANTAITASIAMYAVGLYRFGGDRVPLPVVAIPIAITVVGYHLLVDDYRHRLLLGGLVWAAQGLHLLILVARQRRRSGGRGLQLLLAGTALFTAAMLHRVLGFALGLDASGGPGEATAVVVVGRLASLASTLLFAMGALTMIQERAERTALESEGRYRKLFESANEGVLVVESGMIRMANPKWSELSGFTNAQTLGRSLLDFVHPDELPRARELHADRLDGQAEGRPIVLRIRTRSHEERWFRIAGVAFEWHGMPAALNFVTDVTEQRAAEDRIRELAFHDALTGLPNRRLFLDRLQFALAANDRSGGRAAIVFIDLDNFKPLNDRCGHGVGDLLLIEVARRLTTNLRRVDTAARFGGDEFVVLVTGLDGEEARARGQAAMVAEKLRAVLAEPYRLHSARAAGESVVEHRCTATAGVVVFAGDPADPAELLDRADATMYAGKRAGRNTVLMDPGNG